MSYVNFTRSLSIFLFLALNLVACKSDMLSDMGSSIFAVSGTDSGSPIDHETALSKLSEFCDTDRYINQFNSARIDFQAGYTDKFLGSGYSYRVVSAPRVDGSSGLFRANEGEAFRVAKANGIPDAMYPPSKAHDHLGVYNSECRAISDALWSRNSYSVSAKVGVNLSGKVAHGEVSTGDCVLYTLNSNLGTEHQVAFCPAAWFTESIVSGSCTSSSKAQLVMQPI